jgi:uncharacterized membrane protein YphA (DoxX/SURF4 family)
MKQPITFQGRSFLFNVLFVLLNLTGLTLIVLGFHDNFEENNLILKVFGFLLLGLTTFGILLFKGRVMFSSVARVLVGGICIVSGLVKANDPLGFSYKLEEYFEDGALAYRIKEMLGSPSFSLEFLMDYALSFSVFICVVEIVLGVLLIIGGQIKKVAFLTLSMMLFFTFLTWHTASCNHDEKFVDRDTYEMSDPVAMFKIEESKNNPDVVIVSKTSEFLVVDEMKQPQCVDDCGCFGDAMKGSVGRSLTPKESLWKDIVLVYLTLWIFFSQRLIHPNTRKQNLYFTISSLAVISFFSWVFGWSFPLLFGVVVLLSALWIIRAGGKFLSNYIGVTFIVTLISMLFITYVLLYNPLKDYRPYAVGSDLKEKMSDGQEGVYESLLVYENSKTGEVKEFSSISPEFTNSKIWEDKAWTYKSMVQKVIVETKLPSIADFEPSISISDIGGQEMELEYIQEKLSNIQLPFIKLNDKGNNSIIELPLGEFNTEDYKEKAYEVIDTILIADPNVTDIKIKEMILNSSSICILLAKDINDANWDHLDEIKAIQKGCKEKGIPFIMICNAGREVIHSFNKKYGFELPVFVNDEITLKSISRSNPSLLIIQDAIVKGKYPNRSIPSMKSLNKTIFNK